MQEEKKFIPYKVQKGNRPKIEEVINYCLDGGRRQSALDFAAWLRENRMPIKLHSSTTRGHNASYNGEWICYILMHAKDEWRDMQGKCPGNPPYWTVSLVLSHLDKYLDTIRDEKLRLPPWDKFNRCKFNAYGGNGTKSCNPDKPCAGGRDLSVFYGEGFDGLCAGQWPIVKNPDEATVGIVKRLLELEQKARDA